MKLFLNLLLLMSLFPQLKYIFSIKVILKDLSESIVGSFGQGLVKANSLVRGSVSGKRGLVFYFY